MEKPDEMTPQAVCKLIKEERSRKDIPDPLKFGPNRVFAITARVSPTVVGQIMRGEFPGKPKRDAPDLVRKFQKGKVHSLTRICDELGLDLDICLEACGLPIDEYTIQRSREEKQLPRSSDPRIDLADLEILAKLIPILGPLPLSLVQEILMYTKRAPL